MQNHRETPTAKMPPQYEKLIREYAEGDISWDLMKAKGITSYLGVLGALGELGLRIPIAPQTTQAPAQSALRTILQAQPQ
jgi:hypothetical protein